MFMKKFLLASAAILIGAPALAADLPRRSAAPAPAPIFVQAFSWEGFYVGAQVGYGWGRAGTDVFAAPGQLIGAFTAKPDGFLGGLHAGYNLQSGSMVYGVEADVEYSWAKSSGLFLGFVPFNGEGGFQGSLRARVGVAFDRALLYVTGGLAVANVESSVSLPGLIINNDETRFGWTVGAGVQYAIDNNWSARLEYRYTDLGDFNSALAPFLPTGFARADLTSHSVRVGLSYRFGGPARPIVARY
jgi:outer membrane immunogenic protein